MGKIDNWITRIPRLKNSKVARFSYKAEAYANDDIEGVDSYDYSNDMNVPLATHTDFDGSVLSTGARANFSSIPKNGLNHFFGRVSYNLNKVIDFLSDFLDDFIALNNSFIAYTEIVSFSSSATLSNYANGSTKRLLSTAGSNITITLPVGETYLGSNTITLAPSIMLTITKRGTVWVNSSGNAITALTADKWKTARNVTISDADGTNTGVAVSVDGSENETLKLPSTIKATLSGRSKDSYPIPTDAVLQYSFDEIKQLPDNPAGIVYKRDNDWTTNDGWTSNGTVSINNNNIISTINAAAGWLAMVGSYGSGNFISITYISPNTTTIGLYGTIDGTENTLIKQIPVTKNKSTKIVAYVSGVLTRVQIYTSSLVAGDVMRITQAYVGKGSYLDPVIDNSYSEAHAENHGVIPVEGVCGKAGYFNNSYMVATRPALGDDITIYFWAKFDAFVPANWQTIVQSRTAQEQGLSVFQVNGTYRLYCRGNLLYFTDYTTPVNTWHHVCMKMNDITAVLKINGETKVTLTGTYGTTQNLASTIWSGMSGTGGTPNSNPLMGALDGLKIVPRFTTDDEDTGEYKTRANLPKFYATADKWKTARNIAISDADGTNTGTAVSVDGSENETLKLPATIKANLSGNASTATKLATARKINGVDFDGSADITVADSSISDSLVGMIAAFSGTADFSNWLFCDGRAVSRTSYAKLFARIGITWGAGNTTTTFNLPDLREVTLVGAGDSPRTMTDPDVFTVAQFKNATFKSHIHTYSRGKYTLKHVFIDSSVFEVLPDGFETNSTDSTGSTVTRANSMGVGYFIRSS